jgi:hypothetical protein
LPLSPDTVPKVMKLPSSYPNGRWGFASGKRSLEIAEREAVDNCQPTVCTVISVGK